MIDLANITKEDEKLFFDIQFYLELYVEYIMTIRDARYEHDEKFKKMSFKELFEKYVFPKYEYLKNSNPSDIFNSMISVFNQISGFYMLSLSNDEMLKKVDDGYLKKIEDTLNDMFIDKTYCNQFDNRQKIVYLRNAISHTENGRLYKALPDGTIEVKLDAVPSKDKTLKPFHIIVSTYDLHKIANHLYHGAYEYFIPSADVIKDDLFYKSRDEIIDILKNACYYKAYTRFDTKKELIEKVRKSFQVHPDKYTEEDQLRDLRKLVENEVIDNKSFKYDDNQIRAFLSCVERIRNLGFKESETVDPFDFVLRISNHSIYPNPAIHLEEMRMLYDYTNKELCNPNNSIEILDKKMDEYAAKDPNAYITDMDIFVLFSEFQSMTAIALYQYYVFGHMLTNERIIDLDGKTYDIGRMRDSFIHGTWFSYYDKTVLNEFYKDFKYVLYDCDNGQKNEGKWNWKSPVMSFSELMKVSNKVVDLKINEYDSKRSRHV